MITVTVYYTNEHSDDLYEYFEEFDSEDATHAFLEQVIEEPDTYSWQVDYGQPLSNSWTTKIFNILKG